LGYTRENNVIKVNIPIIWQGCITFVNTQSEHTQSEHTQSEHTLCQTYASFISAKNGLQEIKDSYM